MYYIDLCNKYIKYVYYHYVVVRDLYSISITWLVFLDTPLDDCGVYSTWLKILAAHQRRWRRGNMGEEMLWGVKNGDLSAVKKCVEDQVRESSSYCSCLLGRDIKGWLNHVRTYKYLVAITTTSVSAMHRGHCEILRYDVDELVRGKRPFSSTLVRGVSKCYGTELQVVRSFDPLFCRRSVKRSASISSEGA